jgi:hypothetical protein
MYADAELHRLICRLRRDLGCDRCLYRDRALHGIERAREIGDDTVAGGIEDATAVRRDQLIDDGPASLQPAERANFVARHQPAVAGNVGCENRGQFAFDRMNGHPSSSSCRSIAEAHNQRATFRAQIVRPGRRLIDFGGNPFGSITHDEPLTGEGERPLPPKDQLLVR